MPNITPASIGADALRHALEIAEAALADIGDADREPGDDVAWCEARAAEALPTVRAALASAAQPPADGALNTIAVMFHSGEEIEGPDGMAMMVDMSVWNDALDAFDEISEGEMEPAQPLYDGDERRHVICLCPDCVKAKPAQPAAGIWVPTELAERVQETMGEFLMDHGWRQQDMDTSDEFGALLAVATKAAPARWYMVNAVGMATLCADRKDAEQAAADAQAAWPHAGPHRAVQMVEVTAAPTPAAQGDALDRGVREELSIGKAINRAARDLPEGWEIRIDLERHAGVVFLIDPDGNEAMSEGGELFSDQINAAIDAATEEKQ